MAESKITKQVLDDMLDHALVAMPREIIIAAIGARDLAGGSVVVLVDPLLCPDEQLVLKLTNDLTQAFAQLTNDFLKKCPDVVRRPGGEVL